jgi:hypothetical protein
MRRFTLTLLLALFATGTRAQWANDSISVMAGFVAWGQQMLNHQDVNNLLAQLGTPGQQDFPTLNQNPYYLAFGGYRVARSGWITGSQLGLYLGTGKRIRQFETVSGPETFTLNNAFVTFELGHGVVRNNRWLLYPYGSFGLGGLAFAHKVDAPAPSPPFPQPDANYSPVFRNFFYLFQIGFGAAWSPTIGREHLLVDMRVGFSYSLSNAWGGWRANAGNEPRSNVTGLFWQVGVGVLQKTKTVQVHDNDLYK